MNIADMLCQPSGHDSTGPPESTQPPQPTTGSYKLPPFRQIDCFPGELQPRSWFDEYPRASALQWELAPHKASEAGHHFGRLVEEKKILFAVSNHKIDVLESNSDNASEPRQYTFTSAEELEHHLKDNPKPLVRHVFIEADGSRSPLNCSVSMLKCVLANEQVPPDFLKALYAFGEQENEPTDVGLAGFGFDEGHFRRYRYRAEASPNEHQNDSCLWYLMRTAELRRYNYRFPLRSPWTIRQTAVYHSFNSMTGRSFFLAIRAKGLFREEIWRYKSLLADPVAGKDCTQKGVVARAWQTALATHLLYQSWCCRRWDHFILYARNRVQWLLRHNHIVIDTKLGDMGVELEHAPQPVQPVQDAEPRLGEVLAKLPIDGLQSTNVYSRRITNALLALEDTSKIIRRMRQHCKDRHANITGSTDSDGGVDEFLREMDSFSETIKAAQDNLKALAEELKQGSQLYKVWWDWHLWFTHEKLEHERSLGTTAGPPKGVDSRESRKRSRSSSLDASSAASGTEAEQPPKRLRREEAS